MAYRVNYIRQNIVPASCFNIVCTVVFCIKCMITRLLLHTRYKFTSGSQIVRVYQSELSL